MLFIADNHLTSYCSWLPIDWWYDNMDSLQSPKTFKPIWQNIIESQEKQFTEMILAMVCKAENYWKGHPIVCDFWLWTQLTQCSYTDHNREFTFGYSYRPWPYWLTSWCLQSISFTTNLSTHFPKYHQKHSQSGKWIWIFQRLTYNRLVILRQNFAVFTLRGKGV